jgi:hypothetical protein
LYRLKEKNQMSQNKAAVSKALVAVFPGAVALPDNQSHTNRMEISSQTSDRIYVVAQAKSSGEWQCSCPGWIMKKPGRERSCKHLKAMLPALQIGVQPAKKALR